MSRFPFSIGTVVLGGGALLLGGFLTVGFLLPGTWGARAERWLPVAPDSVFALLDGPAGWSAWAPVPDTGVSFEGPDGGPGARMTWDHPEWGSGSFEIVSARPGAEVRYRVLVQDGTMRTEGVVTLTPRDGGTALAWRESGDFGWNPLMGYWALFMERAQGREMNKSLEALEAVLTGSRPEAQAPGPG